LLDIKEQILDGKFKTEEELRKAVDTQFNQLSGRFKPVNSAQTIEDTYSNLDFDIDEEDLARYKVSIDNIQADVDIGKITSKQSKKLMEVYYGQ